LNNDKPQPKDETLNDQAIAVPVQRLVNLHPFYADDDVAIYHADCLAVLEAMEPDAVDVVMMDPPYSSGARNSASLRARRSMRRTQGKYGDRWIATDNLTSHGFAMLVRLTAAELLRVTKKDGHLFSWIDWRQCPVLHGAIESAGWGIRACLVWDKCHFGMGNGFRQQAEFVLHGSKGTGDNFVRHDLGTVFRAKREKTDIHPTMKPETIVMPMISAVPGDVVFDPFMGSGTTLFAARRLGKRAIGVDVDEQWCEVAANRLRQKTLPFAS